MNAPGQFSLGARRPGAPQSRWPGLALRPGFLAWFPTVVTLRPCVVALALMIGAGTAFADEGPPTGSPLQKVDICVGMNRRAFAQVNENDAMAAYKVFCAEIGRKLGYDLTAEMTLFDSHADFAQAIRTGKVMFLPLVTWELLTMGVEDAVDTEFSAVVSGSVAHRWLLLVRRDSGLKSVADLKGKSALLLRNSTAALGNPWIETCLLEQGQGSPEQFFGKLDVVGKPSAAVLPVFFGKAQACIVDQAAFDVMTELNPQVGQELAPVAQSEPMVNGIVCLARLGWSSAKVREDLVRSIGELDRSPPGRQILTLFKCDRLVPFEPAQLDSVRRLFARHAQLQKGPAP